MMRIVERHRRALNRHEERGSVLVMALGFIVVVGMLSVVFLNQSTTNSKYAQGSSALQARIAAVDGGLNTAIQMVRKSPGVCASANSAPLAIATGLVVAGRSVDLTCRLTTTGSTTSASAWAVFITGRLAGGELHGSQGGDKLISGATYNDHGVGGWDFQGAATLKIAGDVVLPTNTCPANIPGVTVTPAPFVLRCVPGALPEPTPTQALPAALPGIAPAVQTAGSCRIYSPGRYTNAAGNPNFTNAPTYLRSGVYLFENVGTITFGNGTYIGGGGPNANLAFPSQCNGGVNPETNGVLFVLSGNSTIVLTNQSQVELFGWIPAGSTNPTGMSIRQALSTDTGWPVSTNTGVLLNDANGNQHRLSVHGSVFIPAGGAVLRDTNQAYSQLQGGIVAGDLEINSSASASGTPFVSNVTAGSAAAQYTLTASSPGLNGAKDISAIAAITLGTAATRPATVNSWTVTNP